MSRRQAAAVGWGMWIVGLVAIGIAAVLSELNATIPSSGVEQSTVEGLIWLSTWMGFGLVGALVVSRRPGNRIGWVLSGITFALGVTLFSSAYARYALVSTPDTGPLGAVAAWFATWTIVVVAILAVALIILYPTGGLSTRLGRYVLRAFVSLAVIDAAAFAFRPGPNRRRRLTE